MPLECQGRGVSSSFLGNSPGVLHSPTHPLTQGQQGIGSQGPCPALAAAFSEELKGFQHVLNGSVGHRSCRCSREGVKSKRGQEGFGGATGGTSLCQKRCTCCLVLFH